MRNLEKLKLRDKTALPAFLQKLYIYSIMSPRATLAISNFFSKKNISKPIRSNKGVISYKISSKRRDHLKLIYVAFINHRERSIINHHM